MLLKQSLAFILNNRYCVLVS